MKTLLLSQRHSIDSRVLWMAAPAYGWDTQRCGFRISDSPQCDALYGETLWARIVAEQLGKHLLNPPHNWLQFVPEEYLQRRVQYCAPSNIKLPYPLFIKPPDIKSFGARVYMSCPVGDEDGGVLVSEPLYDIMHEARFWVLDGRVRAASWYVVDPSERPPFITEAGAFLDEVLPSISHTPHAVVVDMAWLSRGQWVVLEANPAYCSGIYDASVQGVLQVLEGACR